MDENGNVVNYGNGVQSKDNMRQWVIGKSYKIPG